MGKQKSLFYQLKTACDTYIPHFDKHSDKRQDHDNSYVIKSLQSKQNILDFAHHFSDYIKSEFGVKQLRQITPEMCQSFIDKKSSEGCTEKTLKAYQSLLTKLEVCVKHTFHLKVDFQTELKKDLIQDRVSIKEFAFTDNEMKRILDYKGKSKCIEVIKFNSFTGCRINSCDKLLVRDLRIVDDKVYVDIRKDKGGRNRTICIENKEFVQLCKELRSGKNPNDRLFSVKSDSVNKFIRRRCSALCIKTRDGQTKSGNHSIRKNVATNLYRKTGSGSTVSQFLGHGKCRPDIERAYIKDGV